MKFGAIGCSVVAALLISAQDSPAGDFHFSAFNEARWARRTVPDVGFSLKRNYFENTFSANASYQKFRVHARQRLLEPSEYGVRQTGIKAFDKRYVEYTNDDGSIRAGDFYRTWGSGLMFGTVELLELNFDNGLEGFLAEGEYKGFEGALFRGVQTDSTGAFIEGGDGVYASYRVRPNVRVATSAIYLDEGPRHPEIDRRGYEAEWRLDNARMLAVYTYDNYDRNGLRFPHGFYSAASVYGRGWGVSVDYKNYALNGYGNRTNDGLTVGQPFLQFPPMVRPETSMYLIDRDRRAQHFEDEEGVQIEANLTGSEFETRINVSASSDRRNGGYFPTDREDYSPYQGAFLRLLKRRVGGSRLGIQGGISKDVDIVDIYQGGQEVRKVAAGILGELRLRKSWTISGDVQMMKTMLVHLLDQRYRVPDTRDQFLALTATQARFGSLTGVLERSGELGETGGLVRGGARYWPSAELLLYIQQKHQLRLFVGHERGGIRCSGGYCRWVDPLKGVKITLTSQL